jgi:hypothetical protein
MDTFSIQIATSPSSRGVLEFDLAANPWYTQVPNEIKETGYAGPLRWSPGFG